MVQLTIHGSSIYTEGNRVDVLKLGEQVDDLTHKARMTRVRNDPFYTLHNKYANKYADDKLTLKSLTKKPNTLFYMVPIRGIELLTFALRIQISPISACFTSPHGEALITNKII